MIAKNTTTTKSRLSSCLRDPRELGCDPRGQPRQRDLLAAAHSLRGSANDCHSGRPWQYRQRGTGQAARRHHRHSSRVCGSHGHAAARRTHVRQSPSRRRPRSVERSSFQKHFYPTGSPLGAKIPFRDQSLTIVGVVDQARLYDVHLDGRPQIFIRAEDWGYRSLTFVVQTAREPQGVVPEVRASIRRIDPRLAMADVRTMDEVVGASVRQQRLSAVLISGFALGALILAAMGLFGVVSGSVTRRRHELAVRLAGGADYKRVLRLVLGEGATLVGLGMLVGVPGVYFVGDLVRGLLVGVSPTDPPTLLAVASGLGLVAMAACYLPARRVLGIDPAQSLRQE
jgi:FtsX-like permease family